MSNQLSVLSKDQLRVAAKMLKVISHPVKLEILQILGQNKQMDVSTLCDCIGASCDNSMMSHHLIKLKDNGLVVSDRVGKQMFYSLADDSILELFNCIDSHLLK